jgi:uncharacterized OsmC-like protein
MKPTEIAAALDRAQSIFTAKPEKARVTKHGCATMADGLRGEYVEENWKIPVDMAVPLGGGGTAPSPATYLRASLATCLAMGYAMRAAHRGVPVGAIAVDLEADFDTASLFGLPGAKPGYAEFRYTVRIESDAPEADVQSVIDEADARSPVLQALSISNRLVRNVLVPRPAAA